MPDDSALVTTVGQRHALPLRRIRFLSGWRYTTPAATRRASPRRPARGRAGAGGPAGPRRRSGVAVGQPEPGADGTVGAQKLSGAVRLDPRRPTGPGERQTGAGRRVGLRPELVAAIVDRPDRMLVLVPTEEFRRHQIATVERAASLAIRVSDPELGQRNRLAPDRITARPRSPLLHQHA
jgi:hypothetical protein